MADKEMIIDGVDMNECHFSKGDSFYCDEVVCRRYKNCYFKQLKRAEQKLEKIKEYLSTYIETDDHIKTDILKIIEGDKNE